MFINERKHSNISSVSNLAYFFFKKPVTIILEFIVASERRHRAERNGIGEEYLRTGVYPNLQQTVSCIELTTAFLYSINIIMIFL